MPEVKPKFAFCGYPVAGYLPVKQRNPSRPELWSPCGNIASPGCAYCDEHAGCTVDDLPLTEQDIVNRATAKERSANKNWAGRVSIYAVFLFWMSIGIYKLSEPFRPWAYAHRELWWGILIGSVAELLIILSARWTWHRMNWVRWFSRMG